ncbi:MAG: BACON domain-containing protein [Rikenellaceae bacterium]
MAKNLKMSWSKAAIKTGRSTETNAMPTEMFAMGVVKDKSTTLEPTDGESLSAKATGGIQVAYEQGEGALALKTRIMEPPEELYVNFGLGEINEDTGELEVLTHVVQGYWAVEVSPKNVGAIGIRAPYCLVTFKPGRSEEEGEYVDIEFAILPLLDDDYVPENWYKKFRKAGNLSITPSVLSFTSSEDTTGKTVTATSTGNVTASSNQNWCTVTAAAKVATVKVTENTDTSSRTASVTLTADNKKSVVTVTQEGASE